ncbi:MAG: ATP-dependent DNA helicase RecG [Armatimonadetes bacterium]|nr:ATP-dependent DNA helicase RecG [Armatimonadota bacterium]
MTQLQEPTSRVGTGKPIRPIDLDTDVRYVKGVGERLANVLGRLGIFTIRDLLMHFPHRHEDRTNFRRIRELKVGETATIKGKVLVADNMRTSRSQTLLTKVALGDDSGVVTLVWFNQPYLKNKFTRILGKEIIAYGTAQLGQYGTEIVSPEWEEIGKETDPISSNRIVPVYPLTEGLYQGTIRRIIYSALDRYLPSVEDVLPEEILDKRDLVDVATALRNIHFPESSRALEAARYRLVYEEFFLLQLALAMRKQNIASGRPGIAFKVSPGCTAQFYRSLPFELTNAQKRVITEIERDMARPIAMNRLLQGDVGSGKTVVAVAAIMVAISNGYQAAIMAPTEILAEQHVIVFARLLEPLGIEVTLLKGSQTAKEKEQIKQRIASGDVKVVVGTHALIQGDVEFQRLGLVVIDEQHRFGVLQRAALRDKGLNPDVLVMTATPIPRTLALTVYGDLDLSVIDEMPPGRKPVRTYWKTSSQRMQVYNAVRKLVSEGRQVYIVCPLVEESEKLQARAATELAEHMKNEVFPDLELAVLHGQMKAAEKEAVMEAFRDGKIQILVSTTVIEVGVDVPNASVMVIEDAERFGLAQLHQLRGRVGRGEHQSYCVLVADPKTDEGRLRLEVMTRTFNGFEIAEEDLKLRGPGEFYGTKQSGLPSFRLANILRDVDILEQSRNDAFDLVEYDSRLESPKHARLRTEIYHRFEGYELVAVS